jgi:COMPASS component SWD1
MLLWLLRAFILRIGLYTSISFIVRLTSPFSKIVAALLSSGEAFLIDTRSGHQFRSEIWEKVEEPHPITAIRFHPKGSLIFASTSDGHILVFNIRTKMVSSHTVQ